MGFLVLCGLSVLLSRSWGEDAELPGWKRLVGCRKAEGNVTFAYGWQEAGGVELLVRPREEGTAATLVLDAEGIAAMLDSAEGGSTLQTRAYALQPAGTSSDVEVTLKVRTTEWALYLDGRLAATLPAPFALPGEVFIEEHRAEWVRSQPSFRPVPRESFHSDFMIEEGAPNQLYPWKPESGDWRIHTALDNALARPESDLARIKQVPLTADKSPNFYSLKGMGEKAIITTGYDYFDDYDYAAAMLVNAGEAGLVFYHIDAANYYAFTIDLLDGKQNYGILRLWRMRGGERTVLAETRANLFPGQWYMPRIRAHTDEIVCLLDNFPVLKVVEPLPVGGKVGLYANHNEEVRFDDVYLSAYERLPLRNAGEIRYQTLVADDAFFRGGGLLGGEVPPSATELKVAASPDPRSLILGRPHHEGIYFGAEFVPQSADAEFGIVAGYRGRTDTHYRCVVRREANRETFRMERVSMGEAEVLDSWSRPRTGKDVHRFSVDATEEGWLRFLEDDQLVILEPVEGRLVGATGIWLGPGTACTLRDLRYGFERERFKEHLQQNEVFAADNFMRHWSSAEGQWIAGRSGYLWHKGDFFSDFTIQMPCVSGGKLHVGVPEDGTEGSVIVATAPDKLTMTIALPGEEPQTYETPLVAPQGKAVSDLEYVLHHEGYWVWITLGGERVLRHRLDGPLPGRQARVDGLSLTDLHRSLVTRINVIDDAFAESPHNWLINGGVWQIVNRFQCTPSWSHMIGESADTMAALWYKALFSGDLTLEFYAGTRHGSWYQRMGDLNCTVMAQETTPSSGYTVTCTEWDDDLSQKWSTLRRDGEVMARSDAYLVPRRRAGLVRKFLNPLVSQGRPYHGAWYYIKLRKFGDRLEYYFDNEKIFEETDPQVIQQGLLGIWTFMHSMTVAQVKITFQEMTPRPVTLYPSDGAPAPAPPVAGPAPAVDVTMNGLPFQSLDPAHWSVDDPVGHAELLVCPGAAPGLMVRNRLGSGTMLAKPDFPAAELRKLAGWQFALKRTPKAELNAYYSIGVTDGQGNYTPQRYAFHRISGDSFADGPYQETGSTVVPGSAASEIEEGWTTVQVWIPESLRTPNDTTGQQKVRFEGLGTVGESQVLCGLTGNGPGATYFVRQFTPVFYGTPMIASTAESALFVLRDSRHGSEVLRTTGVDGIDSALKELGKPDLNTVWLRVKYGSGEGYVRELSWIDLPDQAPWELAWDGQEPNAVVLRRTGSTPDPRFAGATLALADGTALPLEPRGPGELLARLPRGAAAMKASEPLRFSVVVGGVTMPASLDWQARPCDDRPVLLGIKGMPGFCASFENGYGRLNHTGDIRQTLGYGGPAQDRYLQVRNTELGQRLYATFGTDFSLTNYPLCQFRYRGYDMSYVSLTFSNSHHVRLSEDYAAAAKVRLADQDLTNDGNWHTWGGMVTDAFSQTSFLSNRFQPTYVRFGSAEGVDQTGRYSRLDLDDVVFGPAVGKASQLAFTPEFFDADGVRDVLVAVSASAKGYADLADAERQELAWVTHPVGQSIAPELPADLGDGVHHLFYKAVDTNGTESAVADLPFLLDTKPLEVAQAFEAYSDPGANGLAAVVRMNNHGGSPWAIEQASFVAGDKARRVPAWTNLYEHAATSDKLTLNYPLIMRRALDEASNGQTVTLTIKNIVDGAGNASPDLAIPYQINYAKDKTGPSWYWLKFGTAVHWFYNWDGSANDSLVFSPGSNNQMEVVKRPGGVGFVDNLTYQANGDLVRQVDWKPATHPWLSCRIYLPKYRAGLRLILVLATNQGTYTLSTMAPDKAGTELNRGLKFPWAAKQWVPISANVRELFQQAGMKPEQLANLVVSTVTIARRNCENREPLYLDDFYLHAAPAADQASARMTWYAYDASGVDRLEMACLGPDGKAQWTEKATERTVNLHDLSKRVKGCQWFQCTAYDKAGNASQPFYLPVAGN